MITSALQTMAEAAFLVRFSLLPSSSGLIFNPFPINSIFCLLLHQEKQLQSAFFDVD